MNLAAETMLARLRAHLGRDSTGAGWLPLVTPCLILVLILLAPILAPYDPTLPAGKPFLPPDARFWLGTDSVGRDVLSRVLLGMQSTVWATLIVIGAGVVIGNLIGLVAGMSGGVIDAFLMRTTDAFLALPGPVLAIAVVGALGPSLENTIIALVVVWWPLYARIVRGEVRTFLARPAVEAARISGIGPVRLALRHLLPGTMPPVLVAATMDVGLLILTLASLSFLGLGSPDPAPELGAMSARGFPYLLDYWWVPAMPGLGVFVLAFVANIAGDALRDLMTDR